jgi:uncharacterized protein YbcI
MDAHDDGSAAVPTPAGAAPEASGSPLLEISNRVAALHKRYSGKGPESARTHYHGDLVVVILRGGYTRIEQTLIEEGHEDTVHVQRRELQQIMRDEYVQIVRSATGREIEAFLSANHHDPDVQVEIFLLADPA